MKIIITGDERFDKYRLLRKKMNLLTMKLGNVEVVSGGRGYMVYDDDDSPGYGRRTGAEALGERWACEWMYKHWIFFIDRKFGKDDVEDRLHKMLKFGQAAVIFWNGEDKQTRKLIKQAQSKKYRKNLKYIKVVRYISDE